MPDGFGGVVRLSAFHIRRRLTELEQLVTGPVVDIRGTPEAFRRADVVRRQAPHVPERMIQIELTK